MAPSHEDVLTTHPVPCKYVFRDGKAVLKCKKYSSKPAEQNMERETKYV